MAECLSPLSHVPMATLPEVQHHAGSKLREELSQGAVCVGHCRVMVEALEAEEPNSQGRGRTWVHGSPKAVNRGGVRGRLSEALHTVPTRGTTG